MHFSCFVFLLVVVILLLLLLMMASVVVVVDVLELAAFIYIFYYWISPHCFWISLLDSNCQLYFVFFN